MLHVPPRKWIAVVARAQPQVRPDTANPDIVARSSFWLISREISQNEDLTTHDDQTRLSTELS